MQFDEAQATLQDKQLNVERIEVVSGKRAGTVVGQEPRAGARVGENTTVTLSVSNGTASIGVPSVIGLPEADASDLLKGQGFGIKTASQDVADPSLDGLVLTQDPEGGQQAKLGTTVTITLGRFIGP